MGGISREFLRRIYLRDRLVFFPLAAAVGLQVITWALLLWRGFAFIPQAYIPLHYNIYFGIDLVGPGYGLLFPVGFGFLALILNVVFVSITYEWQRLLAYVFSWGTAFLELVLLVASVFMLLLNL